MPTTLKTPVPAPVLPPGKRWKKRMKRVGWIGLGFVGMGVVVFFLLPVWMSNAQGRAWVLERLNAGGGGARISCDDWSLSWFKGTRIKNLAITLPDNSRLLFCPHVKTELTLWGILLGNYDLGATTVETLQVNLTKYADGTTSLDARAPPPISPPNSTPPTGGGGGRAARGTGLLERLRSLRGSLQVQSAVVTVNSARAGGGVGESVTYTDVRAAVTIASADAPFHLALTASGPGRDLSVNAVLPAPASWPPRPWALLQDVDISATNMPTGLLCDWLGMDPRWQQSLGPAIATLSLVHHAASGESGDATLVVRGSDGRTFVQGRGTLRVSGERMEMAVGSGGAALMASPPLDRLLGRVNPVFGSLHGADGTIEAEVEGLRAAVGGKEAVATGEVRVTFPQVHLDRTGVLKQLLDVAGVAEDAGGTSAAIVAEASPLRLEVGGGGVSYTNFVLTFPPPPVRERMVFGGQVDGAGEMELSATVPLAPGQGLSAGTAQVGITGSAERPVVVLPK
ncbi:MAG TPA: hypothetical protein VH253_09550 [Phycisphaerae bacterium]|nr:hypothetical protein [Phycisphaerae bacterium]